MVHGSSTFTIGDVTCALEGHRVIMYRNDRCVGDIDVPIVPRPQVREFCARRISRMRRRGRL